MIPDKMKEKTFDSFKNIEMKLEKLVNTLSDEELEKIAFFLKEQTGEIHSVFAQKNFFKDILSQDKIEQVISFLVAYYTLTYNINTCVFVASNMKRLNKKEMK